MWSLLISTVKAIALYKIMHALKPENIQVSPGIMTSNTIIPRFSFMCVFILLLSWWIYANNMDKYAQGAGKSAVLNSLIGHPALVSFSSCSFYSLSQIPYLSS